MNTIASRFRGFLPVVIDVETAGFNAETDALLELAAVIIHTNDQGLLHPDKKVHHYHIEPFTGANLDKSALEFTGIKPYHPFRFAIPERQALDELFATIAKQLKLSKCSRAVMVAHNPIFDLSFVQAAIKRSGIKKSPFHSFTALDTATLSALAFGQTVLAKAVRCAGIEFNADEAHSAIYDAERTAELFCYIMNNWKNPADETS